MLPLNLGRMASSTDIPSFQWISGWMRIVESEKWRGHQIQAPRFTDEVIDNQGLEVMAEDTS